MLQQERCIEPTKIEFCKFGRRQQRRGAARVTGGVCVSFAQERVIISIIPRQLFSAAAAQVARTLMTRRTPPRPPSRQVFLLSRWWWWWWSLPVSPQSETIVG